MAFTGRGREAGSTLVEFGLSVMVLMTLIFGVVEFSRALYAYHFVSSAARHAARWAAVNGSTCSNDGTCVGAYGMSNNYATVDDIKNYVKNQTPMGILSSDVTTTPCWPSSSATTCSPPSTVSVPAICSTDPSTLGCNCYSASIGNGGTHANSPGCAVRVTVDYNFSFIFPFVRAGTLRFSSTSESVITH